MVMDCWHKFDENFVTDDQFVGTVKIFSKKLDSLFDHLDNRCTMHGFQCDACE
jgi:hypothetical protein